MSKENSKESKGHGLHLHLPRKPGRSHSAGRVSPISFFTSHKKSSNGHAAAKAENGNGWKNGAGIGVGVGIKDSSSAPSSSHGSPAGSPTHPRKGSFGSTVQVSVEGGGKRRRFLKEGERWTRSSKH